MTPLSSILTLILLVNGLFVISMVAILVVYAPQNEIISRGQALLVSISQQPHEDASPIRFVCSGIIVSRDYMIALSECFSNRNSNEIIKESFLITSGSNFWYSSAKIHQIVNITKVNSILCIRVCPPFAPYTYDGSKIVISDRKEVGNTYRARGWDTNSSPHVTTWELNSTEECIDAPGALIIDQKNRLLGFQGVNCDGIGPYRTTNVYHFKPLIGVNGSCTTNTFIL